MQEWVKLFTFIFSFYCYHILGPFSFFHTVIWLKVFLLKSFVCGPYPNQGSEGVKSFLLKIDENTDITLTLITPKAH